MSSLRRAMTCWSQILASKVRPGVSYSPYPPRFFFFYGRWIHRHRPFCTACHSGLRPNAILIKTYRRPWANALIWAGSHAARDAAFWIENTVHFAAKSNDVFMRRWPDARTLNHRRCRSGIMEPQDRHAPGIFCSDQSASLIGLNAVLITLLRSGIPFDATPFPVR